jgi:hypothetical protein
VWRKAFGAGSSSNSVIPSSLRKAAILSD